MRGEWRIFANQAKLYKNNAYIVYMRYFLFYGPPCCVYVYNDTLSLLGTI